MYLAKYIAKAKPAFRISADDWAQMNDVQRYLMARVIGRLECNTVLLGFNMCHSSHLVRYLQSTFEDRRHVLKPNDRLPEDDESEDIYYDGTWDKYLERPDALADLTYYELFKHYNYNPCSVSPPTLRLGPSRRGSKWRFGSEHKGPLATKSKR